MTLERSLSTSSEQDSLRELVLLQENTGTKISKYLQKHLFAGTMRFPSEKFIIIAGPRDFVLTIFDDDKSYTIFEFDEYDSDRSLTNIESKYLLKYSKLDEETRMSLTTYRFNQNETLKSYKNEQNEEKKSKMTGDDFTNAFELLTAINTTLKPLLSKAD